MCFINVRQVGSWFNPIALAKELNNLYYALKGKPLVDNSRSSNKNSYSRYVSEVFLPDLTKSFVM